MTRRFESSPFVFFLFAICICCDSQADDAIVKKAFRRLTQPAKGATYSPAELVVLLNRFDFTATGVPIKRLTRALSLCLENKVKGGVNRTQHRSVIPSTLVEKCVLD